MNPKMKDVVRTEVLKLLAAGIIYPIADSKWVMAEKLIGLVGLPSLLTAPINDS